jgi:hypothetical protein
MNDKIKNQIDQSILYLKSTCFVEPVNIRVEACKEGMVVLSYEEKKDFSWACDRYMKEFLLVDGLVTTMQKPTLWSEKEESKKEQYEELRKIFEEAWTGVPR